MTDGTRSKAKERQAGIVKVSTSFLGKLLFGDACKIERIGLTDDDFAQDTFSLLVTGHHSLPVAREGQALQTLRIVMKKDTDGNVTLQGFEP